MMIYLQLIRNSSDVKAMKIALVNSEHPSIAGSDHGGIATYTYTMARYLAKRGHTVHLLTRSSVLSTHFSPSVHFYKFGFEKSGNPVSRLLDRINRTAISWEKGNSRCISRLISRIAAGEGLDIVDIPDYGGMAGRYKPAINVPCIITFHMPSEMVDSLNGTTPSAARKKQYQLERDGVIHAAGYKVPSLALKNHVSTLYHLSPVSVPVIRNPLDHVKINYPIRESIDETRFDILFSGRLERRKGAELIQKSIKSLLRIHPSITISFAGETEISNTFNYRYAIEQILSPDERERVWFLGPLSSTRLHPLYSNSSVFLFPSLFENCPYALIEAMAAGLPVIATEGSGIGEIISHDSNGILFPQNDIVQLVEAVKMLFNDRDRAARIGQNAARSVKTLFDPEKIIDETVEFYQSIINANGFHS